MLPRFRSNLLTGASALEFYCYNVNNQKAKQTKDVRVILGVTFEPNDPSMGILETVNGYYKTPHTYNELVDLLYPHEE